MEETLIQIANLDKTYAHGAHALKCVNLEIKKGEIFGLLGPNGAGKTTLIGIVAGLVRKTSGDVRIAGKSPVSDYKATRRIIGVVQQETNSDIFFKVSETLECQAGYFGIPKGERRTEEILTQLGLWEKRDTRCGMLSGGMKRRVMIAKALVHDPHILFLDEPTAGVDVELRESLWELIAKFKEGGKTVVLTTHYLEEAEALADRIGIMADGVILEVDETARLLERHGGKLGAVYRKLVAASRNKSLET